ncbi:MAG: bifunctional UDP-N-acetylglucosamine pyrophosphorylase / Glucosamine-1-phosphate N-acetyltransferase [Comamonadaceae bacterium]|nr:MAG: bifunctional UDP-N-acetylglucosamine pyrophosphorylase / Glucosamine-1-phosphate N-acetyltransferase [Comamonadaceae bacterium]
MTGTLDIFSAKPLDVVIMAAGKGTRMKSKLPKVLHQLAGRALLQHVVDTAAALMARQVTVITGHGATEVEAAIAGSTGAASQFDLNFVRQEPQLGTGHAVQQAVPVLRDDGVVVVLSGDVPLTQADTLQQLIAASAGTQLALLTIEFADPNGYGRIVREGDTVKAIVEQKDATPEQRRITEVYSGIMAVPAVLLKSWLTRLDNQNAQGEYYLTDIVKFAVADGLPVVAHKIADAVQVAGVNSPVQLAELERAYQKRIALQLMEQGVRLADPARLDVRGSLQCGQDVSIDVNCVFEGQVSLGEGARIGANCVIRDAVIGAGAVIHPFTHIEGGKPGSKDAIEVGAGALIGPFARLRPGAKLGAEVHIGNFVEVKNSTLAKGAKANHLAYLGDATVGERVNYGAGSITANYDGAYKHRTVIEADVHIGSNCVLIAPVTIGAGGTVGGGSTSACSTSWRSCAPSFRTSPTACRTICVRRCATFGRSPKSLKKTCRMHRPTFGRTWPPSISRPSCSPSSSTAC